jgi:hypothetical protein
MIRAPSDTSNTGRGALPNEKEKPVKKQVRTIKLNRETVRSLNASALREAAGGFIQSEGCSKNGHSCIASCSDVPCD